jgi:SAM dependent carboxyl methyltransferase
MPNEPSLPHGVMEGQGAYNRYAKLPAAGAVLALPLLEKAVASVALDSSDQPVVIGDYGSSQGKNSMVPIQIAIRILRQRLGPGRAISVFHIDQPSNDFNSLFGILDADPNRYCLDEPNVFPAAVGRSFYENVLPPNSVHLAWCAYAAVWLSRLPALVSGHIVALRGTEGVRAEFARQGARDWEAFLSLRAKEMRPGGRLVVVLPALTDEGSSGFENLFDQANLVLADMVAERAITAQERSRMTILAFPRRKPGLLAPFANGPFEQLTVEDFEMSPLPDGAWNEYKQDGNKEALAAKHALFFRSVFMPSLASALDRVREGDAEALRAFADRLEAGLKRRLASRPAAINSFVQTIVFAKQS